MPRLPCAALLPAVSEPWMPFGIFVRGGRRIPVDRFSMLPGNSGQDSFDVPPSRRLTAERPKLPGDNGDRPQRWSRGFTRGVSRGRGGVPHLTVPRLLG